MACLPRSDFPGLRAGLRRCVGPTRATGTVGWQRFSKRRWIDWEPFGCRECGLLIRTSPERNSGRRATTGMVPIKARLPPVFWGARNSCRVQGALTARTSLQNPTRAADHCHMAQQSRSRILEARVFRTKELRGSRLRCLMLTSGSRAQIARRLGSLVQSNAVVREANLIKPCGFLCPDEAKLGETPGFLNDDQRESVTAWWLAIRARANTPNWDLVANCLIADRPGLLLVEAKAHSNELKSEGKTNNETTNAENHRRIAEAIDEANGHLKVRWPGGWSLS